MPKKDNTPITITVPPTKNSTTITINMPPRKDSTTIPIRIPNDTLTKFYEILRTQGYELNGAGIGRYIRDIVLKETDKETGTKPAME